jgi:hypothetical protein
LMAPCVQRRYVRALNNKVLFGCNRFHINLPVLECIGVELELNSTPTHVDWSESDDINKTKRSRIYSYVFWSTSLSCYN